MKIRINIIRIFLMTLIMPAVLGLGISFDTLPVKAASANLLVNPGAETNSLSGWTLASNVPSAWSTNWNAPRTGNYSFSTTNFAIALSQTVDLTTNGYTAQQLDTYQPPITFSDWLQTRGDQGGRYYLTFKLLDGSGNVVATSGSTYGTSASKLTLNSGVPWFQISHTFSNYGTGVRSAYFEFAGSDQSGWAGYYGTEFDDASLTVGSIYNLAYGTSGNGSITGGATQSVVQGRNGAAVTAVPGAHHHFVSWSDNSTQNPRTDTNISGNLSVAATFAIDINTLTYTAGSNGSITGNASQTVVYGGSGSTVTATPATGYHFVKWSDDSTQNPRTDTNVVSNVNVSATFAADSVAIQSVDQKSTDKRPTVSSLPTFSGTATPGTVITVTVHSDPVSCTTTADATGKWSCTLASALPVGDHSVVISAVTTTGNAIVLSSFPITVETLANTGDSIRQPLLLGVLLMIVSCLGLIHAKTQFRIKARKLLV